MCRDSTSSDLATAPLVQQQHRQWPRGTANYRTDNLEGYPLGVDGPLHNTRRAYNGWNSIGTEAKDDERITGAPPATERIHTAGNSSPVSTPISNSTISSIITACRNGDASDCSTAGLSTNRRPVTSAATSSSPSETTSTEPCTPLPSDKPVTEYSIVYTSTITFYGSSTDYTPPYSPIVTPNFCSPTGEALATFFSTIRVSNSTSTLTVNVPSSASPSYDLLMPAPMPVPTFSIDLPEIITQTPDAAGKGGGEIIITMRPFLSFSRQVVTFITTDKNPSVVFSPEPTPDFGQPEITGGPGDGNHKTVEESDDWQTRTTVPDSPESVRQSAVPTFQITAGGDQVIIGKETVSNLKPDQTATVTVGSEVFTILPTAVVGLGTTITKPAPQPTSPPEQPAATRTLGGLPVTVSGLQTVVIQGTTLNIPPQSATATTATINGHAVTLGARSVAIGHETLLFPTPQPTHAIITGGQMLTAIGPSILILNSTTITYGPDIHPENSTTTINGEPISIGPSGISLHGTTLGGPSADPQATEYEIVGGITVGKVLPSLVVLNGATYSLNQDVTDFETTVVVAGQTVTVGPRGLVVASVTLTYPGESVTATLSLAGASRQGFPVETRLGTVGGEDDDESGAGLGRGRANGRGVLSVLFSVLVWTLA
ncbi:hypothetical protein CCMA1212_008976 [Trichoderma ghanense]|uniref:Ca2+-modulated nonselective cation channel polycystin n=1 Tax=Trichoderma ghanense TaxID=65468 RepID=A0ABY2GUD6_9HYPO